ncbi:N-acetylneuraminate synthase [Azotosporobacter soli]|uniref:N-acetylneuraminate synthase n=1 Tax=Azotosporobacter soli TaxID=3055040 RepID=UPI0031FF3ED3
MNRTYIIAEAGVNHNGSMELAKQLIDVAVAAGADAVKFQSFKADKLVSKEAPKAKYQKENTTTAESQYEMLKKLELTNAMHRELVAYCNQQGIEFLSTPFDEENLTLLVDECNIAKIKIPSGEITNAPLLLKIAQTGRPVILSTGMCTLSDVEAALGVLAYGYLNAEEKPSVERFAAAYSSGDGQEVLRDKVILLHCTTEYPAVFNDVNLRNIETLKAAFDLPVGFSDHTQGIAISLAAAARGAILIEKHFTLNRKLPGPDHRASLEPEELKAMVLGIRQIEQALGRKVKIPTTSEQDNKIVARKSLVAAQAICQGEVFNEDNIAIKRPGSGISPLYYWDYLGRRAARDFKQDEKVT